MTDIQPPRRAMTAKEWALAAFLFALYFIVCVVTLSMLPLVILLLPVLIIHLVVQGVFSLGLSAVFRRGKEPPAEHEGRAPWPLWAIPITGALLGAALAFWNRDETPLGVMF
ncbi:hypothetical protein [Vannielia sp. SX4]|uniref:hypothetical protein n=1 Tax=Vannielia sp. SX4 TaxID=3463852 RepID=UPI004057FCEE